MAIVRKYMSKKTPTKVEKYKLNVTYHSVLSTKLDCTKALKYIGDEMKKGWIDKTKKITITNLKTKEKQSFIYLTDFTSSAVNSINI